MKTNERLGKAIDIRILAAGIAVVLMVFDDRPTYFYGTGRDPGAAAMLSIILANTVALLVYRGVRWDICVEVFLLGAVLKLFVQGLFWIPNATLIDLAVLLISHAMLGWLVCRKTILDPFEGAVAGLVGTGVAIALAAAFHLLERSWVTSWWQLAFARILVPCLFWTAMLFVRREWGALKTQDSGASNPITSSV